MDTRGFSQKHKSGIAYAVIIIISLIAMTFSSTTIMVRIDQVGFTIVSSVQGFFAGIGDFLSSSINSVGELSRLKEEYDSVSKELRKYQEISLDYEALKIENARLREALDFYSHSSYPQVPAQVIGKDPGVFFSTFTISKGILDGIDRNMPVITIIDGTPCLVGKIIKVGLSSSQVLPLHDPSMFVAARLLSTRFEGLMQGTGGTDQRIIMKYVNKLAKNNIHVRDYVVTSGLSSLYPQNIRIGYVSKIIARDFENTLELEIQPLVDYTRLEQVFVIKTEVENE